VKLQAMIDDPESPAPKPARPQPSEREKRLAEALRANLRRRKAGTAPAAGDDDESSS
jgi:hypothetical protein